MASREDGSTLHFNAATAASPVAESGGSRQAAPAGQHRYRFGLNQPMGSPTQLRMSEMAATILQETDGRLRIDVFPDGQLGSDNTMLAAVREGRLELYMAGNNLGVVSSASEIPALPFLFNDSAAVFRALDGELGRFIRRDLAAHHLHAFPCYMQNGFHHLTTNSHPIRDASDLRGMIVRTPMQQMPADFFRLFGAEPKGITFNQLYASLRDGIADAQTDPLGVIRSLKLYEVQRYLSLTNHSWSGFLLIANMDVWNRLPGDLQETLERNTKKYALLQREDVNAINESGVDFLQQVGMVINTADTDSFKAKLPSFYQKWRAVYGDEAWGILEGEVGRLG